MCKWWLDSHTLLVDKNHQKKRILKKWDDYIVRVVNITTRVAELFTYRDRCEERTRRYARRLGHMDKYNIMMSCSSRNNNISDLDRPTPVVKMENEFDMTNQQARNDHRLQLCKHRPWLQLVPNRASRQWRDQRNVDRIPTGTSQHNFDN